MRKSEVFLQMVATQHQDRHWSRDLQVWVCLLPPPPRCGQGPPGTPWRVCHPTAARESVHQEGVGMIECQHLGKLWWILLFGHSLCKRGIFLLQIWALRSQPCWVTLYQWCVWYLPHKPVLFATSHIQKAGHNIAALTAMPLWITNIHLIQRISEIEYKIAVYIFFFFFFFFILTDICLVQFQFNIMCKSFERHAKHE